MRQVSPFKVPASRRYITLYIFLSVLSIIFMILDSSADIQFAKLVGNVFLSPVQETLSLVQKGFSLSVENENLQLLATRLAIENVSLREAEEENKRLREIMDYTSGHERKMVVSMVIGRDGSCFDETVVINKGLNEGIRRNNAVVTPEGLVGYVRKAFPSTAAVQLITGKDSGVASLVIRSRVLGLLRYSEKDGFILDCMPLHCDISEGDEIITSGLGGIYPKGLKIGVVASIDIVKYELFKRVRIQPHVNFHHLEDLCVIVEASRKENDLIDNQKQLLIERVDTRCEENGDQGETAETSSPEREQREVIRRIREDARIWNPLAQTRTQ
jgi:rod shape-determining protein MreC